MAFDEEVPYEVISSNCFAPSLIIDGKPVRRVGITLTGADGAERHFVATWHEVAWAIADDLLGQGGFDARAELERPFSVALETNPQS